LETPTSVIILYLTMQTEPKAIQQLDKQ